RIERHERRSVPDRRGARGCAGPRAGRAGPRPRVPEPGARRLHAALHAAAGGLREARDPGPHRAAPLADRGSAPVGPALSALGRAERRGRARGAWALLRSSRDALGSPHRTLRVAPVSQEKTLVPRVAITR